MSDKLEQFIKDNREAFDTYEPNPAIWGKIEKSVHKKTIRLKTVLWRAAAVIIIFGASLVFHRYIDMLDSKKDVSAKIPEIQEAEIYYSGLLSSKLNEIKPMLEEHPGIDKEMKADLNELDKMYDDLKKDLKDNVSNQEVIEAMIQNYRLRLSILEDILNEFNKEKKDDKSIKEIQQKI